MGRRAVDENGEEGASVHLRQRRRVERRRREGGDGTTQGEQD